MLETAVAPNQAAAPAADAQRPCRVAVLWIDWYAYHVARFAGLAAQPTLRGEVVGIELVGGVGVHAGLRFREELPEDLPIQTLFPNENWQEAGQLRIARAVWARLDTLQPQVVLVPGYYTLAAIASALWARIHGRTSVLMTESTREDHARAWIKEKAKALLIRTLFGWAVAGGRRHRDYLAALGFPADRVARFYDVVDNDGLARRADRLRSLGRTATGLPKRYFLYVGRMAVEKNLDVLVDAYCMYRTQGGTWPLVLVGDGPERGSLEERAWQLPFAADIHFAGHKNSAELPFYYAFAGCFVLPSTREPWGLVVNEAMACGLPVLVSDHCGCADDLVVPGETGWTFSPDDPHELTACLFSMERLSPAERARMRTQVLEQIANYSPQGFADEIARIVLLSSTLHG